MARPAIAICPSFERARWHVWDDEAILVPRSYAAAVQRAGGLPLILAPEEALTRDPDEALERVDGLLLSGGADIDPGLYHAQHDPATGETYPERDAFEAALTRRAMERDLPLLGVCRGMQLMNVACGGTLHQHLPDVVGHEGHRPVVGTFEGSDHLVRLAEGSLAYRAAGESPHTVLSHHHQGVDRVGEGLTVTGWAEMDDLPEALEATDRGFALGVQWHPEADERSRLVAALVEEAAARAAARV